VVDYYKLTKGAEERKGIFLIYFRVLLGYWKTNTFPSSYIQSPNNFTKSETPDEPWSGYVKEKQGGRFLVKFDKCNIILRF
jgi:hypothetical protein